MQQKELKHFGQHLINLCKFLKPTAKTNNFNLSDVDIKGTLYHPQQLCGMVSDYDFLKNEKPCFITITSPLPTLVPGKCMCHTFIELSKLPLYLIIIIEAENEGFCHLLLLGSPFKVGQIYS